MEFNIHKYKSLFNHPVTFIKDSFWKEHIPFAFFLMDILKPEVFVELGVYQGGSFNPFCDAVRMLSTGTKCFGVDNWEGDPHNGMYDISVYQKLAEVHRKNYSGVSELLKMDFDAALNSFADESIDLLHIDGYHLYERVRHDFESWLPKMSGRGVILFHDTNYRERDYGVWKFWEEISSKYPSGEFKFGCGLGILAVGKNTEPLLLTFLKVLNCNQFYHELFSRLGCLYPLKADLENVQQLLKEKNRLLDETACRMEELKGELADKDRQIADKDRQIEDKDRQIEDKDRQINNIYQSIKWKISEKVSCAGNIFCPAGSIRRKLLTRIVFGKKY